MKLPDRGVATLLGLVATVWWASLTKGAHDLWAASVLFGLITCAALISLYAQVKSKQLVHFPLLSSYLLMLSTFALCSRNAYDANTTRVELWILFFGGIAFLLLVNVAQDRNWRSHFVKYGGLAVIPVAVVAVYQSVHTSYWMASSFFTNPAVLAGFSLNWILIFWHFRKEDRLYYWLFSACVVSLGLAKSWWSLISLLTGLGCYYQDRIGVGFSSLRTKAIMTGTIITFFVLLFGYIKFGLLNDPLKSLTERWAWWSAGIRMFQGHPLAGVGLGGYQTAFSYFKQPGDLNTLYAHNFPIQLLSETGLLGFTSVALMVRTFVHGIRHQKDASKEFRAYQASFLSILVYCLSTIYLEYFVGKLLLLMVMALALSVSPKQKRVLFPKDLALPMTLGLVFLVPVWSRPLLGSRHHIEGLRHEQMNHAMLAEGSFKKAISVNPAQDESYAALSKLHEQSYRNTHSMVDYELWKSYLQKALRWKKDRRYYLELQKAVDFASS